MFRTYAVLVVLMQTCIGLAFANEPVSKAKAVFVRDYTHPQLGEAWKDPSGTIWGDVVKTRDGSPESMNHESASRYCESIDADLPSRQDFRRLREYMRTNLGSSKSEIPPVLPNLTFTEKGQSWSHCFWSSTLPSDDGSRYAFSFRPRNGDIELVADRGADDIEATTRCVITPLYLGPQD